MNSPFEFSEVVDQPQTDAELADLRRSLDKGRPFGGADWTRDTVARLGLASCERDIGRPRKERK